MNFFHCCVLAKQWILTQCWLNFAPPSATLAQHQANVVSCLLGSSNLISRWSRLFMDKQSSKQFHLLGHVRNVFTAWQYFCSIIKINDIYGKVIDFIIGPNLSHFTWATTIGSHYPHAATCISRSDGVALPWSWAGSLLSPSLIFVLIKHVKSLVNHWGQLRTCLSSNIYLEIAHVRT